MDFSTLIMQIDNILWATPLIILTFGLALIYCIAIKFGNVTNIKLQWKLLTKGESSEEGLSAFETFCSVAAYRVAVGNIGGVHGSHYVWRSGRGDLDDYYRTGNLCYRIRRE